MESMSIVLFNDSILIERIVNMKSNIRITEVVSYVFIIAVAILGYASDMKVYGVSRCTNIGPSEKCKFDLDDELCSGYQNKKGCEQGINIRRAELPTCTDNHSDGNTSCENEDEICVVVWECVWDPLLYRCYTKSGSSSEAWGYHEIPSGDDCLFI